VHWAQDVLLLCVDGCAPLAATCTSGHNCGAVCLAALATCPYGSRILCNKAQMLTTGVPLSRPCVFADAAGERNWAGKIQQGRSQLVGCQVGFCITERWAKQGCIHMCILSQFNSRTSWVGSSGPLCHAWTVRSRRRCGQHPPLLREAME
jgi:hypothetical protein